MNKIKKLITPEQMTEALRRDGWKADIDEGYLMLLELIMKRQAGYCMSYTEGRFLGFFGVLMSKGRPNAKGREFTYLMTYWHSNRKSAMAVLSDKYRHYNKELEGEIK